MSKLFKGCYTFNYLIIFLILSNLISITHQEGNLQKNKLLRNLQGDSNISSTVITTELPSNFSLNLTSIVSSDLNNYTEPEEKNSTIIFRPTKKKGLSAGGIVGIVIPCVAAVGGVGAAMYLMKANAPIANGGVPVNVESSISNFKNQQDVKEVQVIQQTPIVQQQPIYPINQEIPQIVKVEQVTTVPTHQIVTSQNQLVPGNNTINIVTTSSQVVPENTISQVNP